MTSSPLGVVWRRLHPSPAGHHELLELELPGAWEPPVSSRAFRYGESKRTQVGVFDGDKENEVLFGEVEM